jgi:hypothetical protein
MIDNMTESALKFTKNSEVNETLSKGSDLYKTWLDNQLSFMNEQTEKMKDARLRSLRSRFLPLQSSGWTTR